MRTVWVYLVDELDAIEGLLIEDILFAALGGQLDFILDFPLAE